MRKAFVAVLTLLSTPAIASAQGLVSVVAKPEVKVTPDTVIARLMVFDRNHDGRVAIEELSERVQPLLTRGDTSGDAALDVSEIRFLAQSPQLLTTIKKVSSSGGYSFGDAAGQSSRMHIEGTIDDLRLSPEVNQQASRIGLAFADEMDAAARSHLRQAMTPVLTPDQLAQFDVDLKRLANTGGFVLVTNDGSAKQILVRSANDPAILLRKYTFTLDQTRVATAAVETFRSEQQLDDARRSALVTRMSGILTEEECDNFRAALARRPLVKAGAGLMVTNGGSSAVDELVNRLRTKELESVGRAPAPSVH